MTLQERMKKALLESNNQKGKTGSMYNQALKLKGDGKFFKVEVTDPEKGRNRYNWRLIPYITSPDLRNNPDTEDIGTSWFVRRYFVHSVGPDNIRVCCLYRTFGKLCPVCARRRALGQEGTSDEGLKKYNASERWLLNIYDYEKKDVFVLDISAYFFGTPFIKELNDPSNEGVDAVFNTTENGLVLSCRFDAAPFKFKGAPQLGNVQFKPTKSAIPQAILDKAQDLDGVLIELSAEELTKMLDGDTVEAEVITSPATKPQSDNSEKMSIKGDTVESTPTVDDDDDLIF